MRFTGSILEPEVSGMIKLSHGEAYLPQEKGLNTAASTLASSLTGMTTGVKLAGFHRNDVTSLPDQLREPQIGNGEVSTFLWAGQLFVCYDHIDLH